MMEKDLSDIETWEHSIGKAKPALPLTAYTGEYFNELYGRISISQQNQKLLIKFHSHNGLFATMDYMDKGGWLLKYSDIDYGIFATQFTIRDKKVLSVEIKMNDFIEYDPYTFTRQE